MLNHSTPVRLCGLLWLAAITLPAQSMNQMVADFLSGSPTNTVDVAEATSLERSLQSDPENLPARSELILYYAGSGQTDWGAAEADRRRFRHALWVVEHHPEWGLAGAPEAIPSPGEAAFYAPMRAAWERQIAAHPHDAGVLLNAGRFFENTGFSNAESLLRMAVAADPRLEAAREELGALYGRTLTAARVYAPGRDGEAGRRATAAEATRMLAASTDALELGSAAEAMLAAGDEYYRRGEIDSAFDEPAERLLQRAIGLSGGERDWRQNLVELQHQRRFRERIVIGGSSTVLAAHAGSLATGAAGDEPLPQPGPGVRRLLVSAAQMNSHLLRMVLPDYPVAARRAGIQGAVVFHALIGEDGTVRALQLMRGHPALVGAAREAARQYRYAPPRPLFGAGEILTTITVEFQGT